MISVNSSKNPHSGPLGAGPVPDRYLGTLKEALRILTHRVRDDGRCNESFLALPYQNDFRSFIDNPYIWINYDPANDGELCGWTRPNVYPMDIVLTQYSLRMGKWLAAATIIHELAHRNGAPGGDSHTAELRVLECGLHSANGPYDPKAKG